mgnify:CR=1|jgi:hypothetical protein
MRLKKFVQDPNERKRYTIDYTSWLDDGETITLVTFTPTPITAPVLLVDGINILPDGSGVQFYVSGGVDKQLYEVVVTITTSGTQIKEDVVQFNIKDSV